MSTTAEQPIRFPSMADMRRAGATFFWYGSDDLYRWPVMLTVCPNVSGSIARSNWRVILADMRARFLDTHGVPEYDEQGQYCGGNWYCSGLNAGSGLTATDHIFCRPDTPEHAAMVAWADHLDDYVYADGDDLSELEYEEAPACPDCGARHYLYSGEYDTSRYYELCDLCQRREERAERLTRHYRGFFGHGSYRRTIARVRHAS